MTFTRMLEWIGGPPSEANGAFEQMLDSQPAPVEKPATVAEQREVLRRSLQAQGLDASQIRAGMPA